MASSNSLGSLTDGLDELPYRESSPDDSHAPTTPMQRSFNGDVQAEASGKRVRPDNTSRGIGPQSVDVDAKTMDVSSAELTVTRDMSLSDLRLPFMHGDVRFFVFIALGAIALVSSMLLLMTRSEEPAAIKAEPMASVAAPAPSLVAEPVAAPEPTQAVAPAAPVEAVAAPVAPEKPRAIAKRKVRGTRAAAAKLSTRGTLKATTKTKPRAKKARTRTATVHAR